MCSMCFMAFTQALNLDFRRNFPTPTQAYSIVELGSASSPFLVVIAKLAAAAPQEALLFVVALGLKLASTELQQSRLAQEHFRTFQSGIAPCVPL